LHQVLGVVDPLVGARRGPAEPGEGIQRFAGDGQWFAAGGQKAELRGVCQQLLRQLGTVGDQMLAIVQEQQQLSGLQMIEEGLEGRLLGRMRNAERPGEELRQKRRVTERGQLHQPDAIAIPVADRPGDVQGQPRLATATRAAERDEARAGQQAFGFCQLALAPDKARQRQR
jgi:hypothetical protein